MNNQNLYQTYKVVTLGSSGVGKTSLMIRFVHDAFMDDQPSTIGASFLIKKMNLTMADMNSHDVYNREKTYHLAFEIFDTAGQERYESLAPLYYRSAKVAIIIYDVTNRDTWDRAKRWVTTIEEVQTGIDPILIVILGNKVDIGEESREVTTQELNLFVEGTNHLAHETSAKITGTIEETTQNGNKDEQMTTATSMTSIFTQIALKLLENDRNRPERLNLRSSPAKLKPIENDSIFKRLFGPCSLI